ncbi:hypothetical protein Golomagni_06224 [Golovinomyces magnicellulatus]|nr:hypothetical protein Golomagni_06224 [Golovinomyces magnicellulatus]
MDRVRRKRDSPEPTLQGMQTELAALQEGAEELKVSDHFTYEIASSHRKSTQVSNNRSLTMHRQHMPSSNTANIPLDQRLSQPVPDLLYGYPDKAMSQYYMHTPNLIANTQGLILPFFAIEFKAEGPSSNGNLWVAENQAMGASVACVRIAENLNRRLEECANLREVQKIDTSAFSIAMSGSEARLFITWRDSPEKYIMKHVQSYAMSRPDNYLEFRRVVRNILDWGKDERLRDIFKCLDSLLEENRLQASKMAKDRSRPGSSSGSDVSRRRR